MIYVAFKKSTVFCHILVLYSMCLTTGYFKYNKDLGLFSTKALLDAHADHEVEVRTQVSIFFFSKRFRGLNKDSEEVTC